MKKVTGVKTIKSQRARLMLVVVAFVLFLLASVLLLMSRQRVFYLETNYLPPDPVSNSMDMQFLIKVRDGFQVKSLEYARYHSTATRYTNFHPDGKQTLEILSEDPVTKNIILAIRGEDFWHQQALSIITYQDGSLSFIPNFDRSEHLFIDFSAPRVLLQNLDDDPELEVIEAFDLVSEEDGYRTWHKIRYDYDPESNVYRETRIWNDQDL